MYNKVSDLLPLKVLPKVIRASVGWYSGSAESTVDNHEMLVVKGWKRRLQKKVLKVFNPVTKVKKELPENCECEQGNIVLYHHLPSTIFGPLSPICCWWREGLVYFHVQ